MSDICTYCPIVHPALHMLERTDHLFLVGQSCTLECCLIHISLNGVVQLLQGSLSFCEQKNQGNHVKMVWSDPLRDEQIGHTDACGTGKEAIFQLEWSFGPVGRANKLLGF
jgi:hypothetical protein